MYYPVVMTTVEQTIRAAYMKRAGFVDFTYADRETFRSYRARNAIRNCPIEKVEAGALAFVNKIRAHYGMLPVAQIADGYREEASACPLYFSIVGGDGGLFFDEVEVNGESVVVDGERWTAPACAHRFVMDFDGGSGYLDKYALDKPDNEYCDY